MLDSCKIINCLNCFFREIQSSFEIQQVQGKIPSRQLCAGKALSIKTTGVHRCTTRENAFFLSEIFSPDNEILAWICIASYGNHECPQLRIRV